MGSEMCIRDRPVISSSAEVPTYTSTATLNADGTFYDSGQYYCSVVVSPLTSHEFIKSSAAVDSQGIPGE